MKNLSLIVVAVVALAASAQADVVVRPAPLDAALAKKAPYSMIGQTVFRSGQSYYEGSGTVVYSRSVLTAAHTLWDPTNGWSTDMQFNRARNGASSASSQFASRLYVFGSYRSVAARYGQDSARAFASDLGGMRFNVAPAGGGYAGWRVDTGLLSGGAPVLCLGYGAQFHDGKELLAVGTSAGFFPVTGAFLENTAVTFEGGMSGGPILYQVAPDDLRVVGVVVAGSDSPPACGIRALDDSGATFIATYLRY